MTHWPGAPDHPKDGTRNRVLAETPKTGKFSKRKAVAPYEKSFLLGRPCYCFVMLCCLFLEIVFFGLVLLAF